MLSGKSGTYEKIKGTEEVPDIGKIHDIRKRKNWTSEKFGGTWTFEQAMLSGRNRTCENFGVTEEAQTFEKTMLSGKNGTYENFRGHRGGSGHLE